MSEEEIIKILNDYIKSPYKCDTCKYCSGQKNTQIAIQGLLDLYNKEKEKNKKYQDVISNLNKNWISKHEMEEKLNKLKEKEQELSDEQGYWGGTKLQDKIEFYEELLEERN